MKKFIHQAKAALNKDDHSPHNQQPLTDQPSTIQPPTPADVFRYRYQHGVNLGSVFVNEKWLTGHMYVNDSQSAELAAVTGNVKQHGLDATRETFEKHWREYVSDGDLDWLVNDAHCNSVRIPIGYFTLGPAYCHHTPFESVGAVYENAWSAVKSLVSRCHSRGIGALIDLHALPGGANGGDHSGTNSGKAEFWGKSLNLDLAMRSLLFIAKEAIHMEGVVGIQLCNEAEWAAKGMYGWYDDVFAQMGSIDNTMPLYISDAWNLDEAIRYCNGKNSLGAGRANPIVIDTHCYWCFADKHKQKSPQQIVEDASTKLGELNGHDGSVVDHGAAQVVIGEYSCVQAEDSWAKSGGQSKDELVKAFGQAQSRRYQEKSGGSFFWTYRMDWMDGGEWGFKQQTKSGAITAPHSLSIPTNEIHARIQRASAEEQDRCRSTFGAHCNYWDQNHPGQYEHQRFEAGWKIGFNDAMSFFGMRAKGGVHGPTGGDKIGMLDIWTKKRLVESGQAGKFVWEWEQGFRQGVKDFYNAVGI